MTGTVINRSADPTFDRFARLVRDSLDTPIALVSLIEGRAQLMPGAVGLPEPWNTGRRLPLTHSICRYVVGEDAPVVIGDAQVDHRSAGSPTVRKLGVRAYAGYPLRDDTGRAIGSVCAVDTRPRSWSEQELAVLQNIADVCSTEVALRQTKAELQRSANRTGTLSRRLALMLGLSEALSKAHTAADVAQAVHTLSAGYLRTLHAGVWMRSADGLRYVAPPGVPWRLAERCSTLALDHRNPVGAATASGERLYFADRAAQDDRFPGVDTSGSDAEARAIVPMRVGDVDVGTLVLLWASPRRFTEDERLFIDALTSYTAAAVQRTSLLAERASVARTLQSAMLTSTLPEVPGVQLAARYIAATTIDEVGGDWYDVTVGRDGAAELVVGDVAGHDVSSAAVMGELRNILRTLTWADSALDGATPAEVVSRLDAACFHFGIDRHTTLIFGRLARERTGWRFDYSDAGHVVPVIGVAGGAARIAPDTECDYPLNVVAAADRRTRSLRLEAGATLVLYTDGLVERRTGGIDEGIERLRATVERHAHRDLEDMVDAVVEDLLGDEDHNDDDVAVLAARVGGSSDG